MKLTATLFSFGHTVIKVYAAALLQELQIKSSYKKNPTVCAQLFTQLSAAADQALRENTISSHDVDANLAYLSATISARGERVVYSDPTEGLITVLNQ